MKEMSIEEFEKHLSDIFDEIEKKEKEEWENKTPQEKLEYYSKQAFYSKYCKMSIEELEEEKEFNKYMANKLRSSKFHDIYYSFDGCNENVRIINTILELKSMLNI